MTFEEMIDICIDEFNQEPCLNFYYQFKLNDFYSEEDLNNLSFELDNLKTITSIKTLKSLKLYNNKEEVGELILYPNFQDEDKTGNYIRGISKSMAVLKRNIIPYKIFIDSIYGNILSIYVFVIHPVFEFSTKNLSLAKINTKDGSFKKTGKANILFDFNFAKIIKTCERVFIIFKDDTYYIKDKNDLILGKLSQFKELDDSYEYILGKANKMKLYKAYIYGIKNYGPQMCLKVVLSTYEKDINNLYSEYKTLIPENLFNRKRNKIKTWKFIPKENVSLIPGTILIFKQNAINIDVIDKETKQVLGHVLYDTNDNGYPDPNFFEIKKKLEDIVLGVLLNDKGLFAYASYNSKGIIKGQVCLQKIEIEEGKNSEKYEEELKKQKIYKEIDLKEGGK